MSSERIEDLPTPTGSGDGDGAVCKLCCSSGGGILPVDSLLRTTHLTAHYFCLLFSSGLGQAGGEAEGLRGFLQEDVGREVKRGARLKCVYCRKKGATVGCAEPRCKKSYHLNCGHSHKALCQFYDQFKSFCREHRPVQKASRSSGRGGGGAVDQAENECSICSERVVRKAGLSVLASPCCSAFLHRECTQARALAAGPGTRDCPNCGDSEAWGREVRRMGVYVPEPVRPELEEAASCHVEKAAPCHVEEAASCHAKLCFCDHESGRQHRGREGSWAVLGCCECGGRGIHAKCGGLEGGRAAPWYCYTCRLDMREQGRADRLAAGTEQLWEAREQLLGSSSHLTASLPAPPCPAPAPPASPLRKVQGHRITANTSFTDLLGSLLDGESEASPGDSDYESSSQELGLRPLGHGLAGSRAATAGVKT